MKRRTRTRRSFSCKTLISSLCASRMCGSSLFMLWYRVRAASCRLLTRTSRRFCSSSSCKRKSQHSITKYMVCNTLSLHANHHHTLSPPPPISKSFSYHQHHYHSATITKLLCTVNQHHQNHRHHTATINKFILSLSPPSIMTPSPKYHHHHHHKPSACRQFVFLSCCGPSLACYRLVILCFACWSIWLQTDWFALCMTMCMHVCCMLV